MPGFIRCLVVLLCLAPWGSVLAAAETAKHPPEPPRPTLVGLVAGGIGGNALGWLVRRVSGRSKLRPRGERRHLLEPFFERRLIGPQVVQAAAAPPKAPAVIPAE